MRASNENSHARGNVRGITKVILSFMLWGPLIFEPNFIAVHPIVSKILQTGLKRQTDQPTFPSPPKKINCDVRIMIGTESEILKLLVLTDQQSKTHRHSIYNNIKERKAANLHI